MSYLTLIITVPLTVFALLFAISNTQDITVSLISQDISMTVPLALLVLGMLGLGFLSGAFFVWLNSRKTSYERWKALRRVADLERELENTTPQSVAPLAPALPSGASHS